MSAPEMLGDRLRRGGHLTPYFDARLDRLDIPVGECVSGVVEHLPNDLPTDPRVSAALHLNECRHALLVEKEMIEAPAASAAWLRSDSKLLRDEQPPVSLAIGRQQIRVSAEQVLQVRLSRVLLLTHLNQCPAASQEDAASHAPEPSAMIARTDSAGTGDPDVGTLTHDGMRATLRLPGK